MQKISLWGFKSAGNASVLELWAMSSRMEWTERPGGQVERPPQQPETDSNYGPTAPRMSEN
jgi:hypothetical protein